MPKVGNKHYAYTPQGIKAAKKAAKKKGTPLKMSARAEAANRLRGGPSR
jgi:hypothetical protein